MVLGIGQWWRWDVVRVDGWCWRWDLGLDFRLVLEVWVVSELGLCWRLASGGGGPSEGLGVVLAVGLG